MKTEIRLGNKVIGERHPLFIIAEIGVTCNYDLTMAKELIDVVRHAGADAVKFIFWFPEEIMSDTTTSFAYETVFGPRSENMYEMLQKLRFTLDEWREVKAYADQRQVVFFSTVNSPGGIAYAEALDLVAYKLSSWDYNYLPLWRTIASLGKPLLIDTGPVATAEVAKVLQVMSEVGNDQAVLLYCFHTRTDAEMNMRAIPFMRRTFKTPVGYSSQDHRDETDIMAIALGAVVLEKRLTLGRSLPGHHHVLSKEPKEFAAYVRLMRDIHAARGVEELRPSQSDREARRKWFRHLVAARDVPRGTELTADMLEGKRPEEGISPEHIDRFVGKLTKRDLSRNEALSWDHV